ncbi:hypothetical protein EXN66_Car015056 [Channa argus]|uniref:Transmembrane protein 275 n=2 Tax=Channa argus TaxID=215402 RepID=A0A6G1QAC9_CHAAH|nr:hypothetical protein EXN66_Car015056 [Channa argus]
MSAPCPLRYDQSDKDISTQLGTFPWGGAQTEARYNNTEEKEGKREPGGDDMVITDRNTATPVPKKEHQKKKRRVSRPHGLPSPALCCACGLCIMLAGLNITLVGAFAFSTLVPSANPPIIIGPILLLVAFSFFGACCVCSRLPPPNSSRRSKVGGRGTGLMGHGGLGGGAAFEIETSEHTLQDTTAVQLSPTSSPGSSQASSPEREVPDAVQPGPCKLFTMETNGPSCVSATAVYSASTAAGGEVRLNLPGEDVVA